MALRSLTRLPRLCLVKRTTSYTCFVVQRKMADSTEKSSNKITFGQYQHKLQQEIYGDSELKSMAMDPNSVGRLSDKLEYILKPRFPNLKLTEAERETFETVVNADINSKNFWIKVSNQMPISGQDL